MRQLEVKRKQIEYLVYAAEILILWAIGHRIGMEGAGFFLIPWMMYLFLWILVGEQLPDALGRMIRLRCSKGQYMSVEKIKKMAVIRQLVIAGIAAGAMFFLGPFIAENWFHCTYSKWMIQILSPLILLRSITVLLAGFAQGEGSELPAVASCVLRQILIYVFGIFLGNGFQLYGDKISDLLKKEQFALMYGGMGWCLAIVLSEVVVILFTLLTCLGALRRNRDRIQEGRKAVDSYRVFSANLFSLQSPKIYVRLLEIFPFLFGMLVYYKQNNEGAALGYGSFMLGSFAVCLFCSYLMFVLVVPFWSRIAGYIKKDDLRLGKGSYQGGLHLFFSLALTVSAAVSVMASLINSILGFQSPNLVKLLIPGSFWILFAVLAFYSSGLLMRLGKQFLVIGIAFVSDLLFAMVFLILWQKANMGLLALVYAYLITWAVYAILLTAVTIQLLNVRIHWVKTFLIPIFFILFISVTDMLLVKLLTMKLGNLITFLILAALTAILYVVGLIMLRNFDEEELRLIPWGGFLIEIGKLLNVF